MNTDQNHNPSSIRILLADDHTIMRQGEIAVALTMSEGTVKFHINHMLQKLGAADRTQAVLTALKRGFAALD